MGVVQPVNVHRDVQCHVNYYLEVLWPGNQDYALRYREKLYYFSSEEAKEKFAEDPVAYIAKEKPLKVIMEL